MKSRAVSSIPLFFLIAVCVIAADQVLKVLVISNLHFHEVRAVLPGFFNITYITNTGAAFGFLAGPDSWRHIFFQTVSVIALGSLIFLYRTSRQKDYPLFFGSSLVFGGAAGNLIDRIRSRSVIDFLDFYVGSYHWPAFNLADTAITVGGIFLIWHFFKTSSS
ncbi:MAG TPA: signal peptidase II [Thermodesulfobacteriaceae bacterium]|nr:signal peptidase II [Thermodesulfobacteriaceae bacterium]